jgi:hypothetical protein
MDDHGLPACGKRKPVFAAGVKAGVKLGLFQSPLASIGAHHRSAASGQLMRQLQRGLPDKTTTGVTSPTGIGELDADWALTNVVEGAADVKP